MHVSPGLLRLIGAVATEQDGEKALRTLVHGVLELTKSDSAMVALVDDEEGVLELRYGSGDSWPEGEVERFKITDRRGGGIVAYVAASGGKIMTGDVRSEPHYRELIPSTASEAAVPVRDHLGRIRGVLNIESHRKGAYNEDSLQLCEAVAHLIATVLDRIETHAREEALIEVGSALDSAVSEDDLIARVIRVAQENLRFQAISVFLLDPQTERFLLRGTVGRLKDRVGTISYAAGEGCTGWVCQTGQPIRLDDPLSDPRWRGRYLEFPQDQIASFLAVPIVQRGKCIGAIRVVRKVTDNPHLDNRFTEGDQRVLVAMSEQVATGLENLRNIRKMMRNERMIAWGELSAKSSHMMGNRIFALKGDVNELKHLLDEPNLDRDALLDAYRGISTNITRVEEILQDFRDFLTATQIRREMVNMNELVKETIDEVFPRRSRIALECILAEDLPNVSMDSKRIRRALSELIENSISFMDEGQLRIETSIANEMAVRKSGLVQTPRYLQIVVEDTGPGVSADRKSMIFQPFYSSRVKGMGLGLSIVKGIFDAHGGTVFEDGVEGAGARFVMLLPLIDRPITEEA